MKRPKRTRSKWSTLKKRVKYLIIKDLYEKIMHGKALADDQMFHVKHLSRISSDGFAAAIMRPVR